MTLTPMRPLYESCDSRTHPDQSRTVIRSPRARTHCDSEYDVLRSLGAAELARVDAFEIQFHVAGTRAQDGNLSSAELYCPIERKLLRHGFAPRYRYPFVWELWDRTSIAHRPEFKEFKALNSSQRADTLRLAPLINPGWFPMDWPGTPGARAVPRWTGSPGNSNDCRNSACQMAETDQTPTKRAKRESEAGSSSQTPARVQPVSFKGNLNKGMGFINDRIKQLDEELNQSRAS